jgi:hypothetical protein
MKMKLLLGIMFVLPSTLFTQNVLASCTSTSCTGTVTQVQPLSTGDVRFYIDSSMSALNCGSASIGYATLHTTHPNRNEIFSLLMADHIANRNNVTIRIVESTSDCEIGYVRSEN